jgi:hypothetical protein
MDFVRKLSGTCQAEVKHNRIAGRIFYIVKAIESGSQIMKKALIPLLVLIMAVSSAVTSFSPVSAQASPPSNPDTVWQPPDEGTESVAPSAGVETYSQNYPSLQLMPVPPVPPGPGGSIINAYIVNSYGQILSTLRGSENCYLVVSVNSPGYFYLWEYYPSGSTPYGHWLSYRWYRPYAGTWKIGPFQAGAWDPSGRYVWKLWFQSGSYWSTRTLSFSYLRGYYPPDIPIPTPQPVLPPSINSFTTNMPSIDLGQTATLTWTTNNASTAAITPGIGTVATSGSTTVSPTSTTTYTLTASAKTGNSISSYTTVTVMPRISPTFSAYQTTIEAGKSTTLTWNAPSATQVYISGVGSFASSGSAQVTPDRTTSYTLTASYVDGTMQTSSATVIVEQPPYLLYGLIGLLAIGAIAITALLLRRPRPVAVAASHESGTRAASASTAVATSAGTETPATSPVEAPPAKLIMPDGSEVLLAGNNRSFGRQDFDKFLPADKRTYISRQHINVWYEGDRYYIEDRSSTNGTRLNGTDIKGEGRHAVNDGDVIELAGKLSITFNT